MSSGPAVIECSEHLQNNPPQWNSQTGNQPSQKKTQIAPDLVALWVEGSAQRSDLLHPITL